MDGHRERLESVVQQVKARPDGLKMSVRKKTPAHQIHNRSWKSSCHRIDVADLNHIIAFEEGVDRLGEKRLIAVCEGQVTMGQLARASIDQHQHVPCVVPELTTFTCAGLINGEGIQTSAFKFGVFTHSVIEMEVVLGDGSVVNCSTSENVELFTFMPESHGTLGIVTLVKVALQPALPYVRSTYRHFETLAQFVAVFDRMVRAQRGAYLEGLVLAKDSYLIIESNFASASESKGKRQFDPSAERFVNGGKYYYQYIRQDVVKNKKLVVGEDYIDTWEFLFRPQRGMWWLLEVMLDFAPLTNNRFMRRIIDKSVHKQLEEKGGFEPSKYLTREQEQRCYVLQDMGIRLNRLQEGIQWVEDRLGVYPLWICAVDRRRSLKSSETFLKHRNDEERRTQKLIAEDGFVVDIGIYGEPTVRPFYHKQIVRDLALFVDEPSTWGVSYTPPEVIKQKHDTIRRKYKAIDAFPGLEEKVTYRGKVDDNINEGPIPNWRLYRDWGPYWYIKFPAAMIAFFVVVLAGVAGAGYGVLWAVNSAWSLFKA